ncbi:hypothetical protein [Falsiroseomonas oryzae]|uniref:hypothetical protein n=1 Tax=Falsiroseomonas oryzae TaxID=2766473 RepID=UPI0022EA74D9|nr:hypothetical protein [Roseomonas sp. MO-31]
MERVEVHPPSAPGEGHRIELIGHLASMLRAAGAGGRNNAASPLALANGLDVFACSESGDARTRSRRCQYITVAI